MSINKRFLRFKNKESYELLKDLILPKSIVFISNQKSIILNGEEFSSNTIYNLLELLNTITDTTILESDTTNSAIVKLYKYLLENTQEVDNILKVIIEELYSTTSRTNNIEEVIVYHNNDIDKLKTTTEELKSSTDSLSATVTTLGNTITTQGETLSSVGGKLDNLSVKVEDHLANKDQQHIPEGGHDKLILVWKSNGTAEWKDLATMFTGLEDILAYGVEWDINVADPHLTRIGNMSLHKTLPILSLLKGCIAQKDKVIYWLNESDWRFKKNPETVSIGLTVDRGYSLVSDIFSTLRYKELWVKIGGVACQIGSINTDTNTAYLVANDQLDALGLVTGTQDVELGAVLNGYDGTVRVYCPDFYIKSLEDGDKRRVWISTVKIDDTWTYLHEILVDAYRCTVLNTVPKNMGYLSTLPVNSAISVVNTATYCRGGGNREAFDKYATGDGVTIDIFRSDLGKPRTDQPRSTFRTECRNAGSEMLSYNQYKNIFYWLWVVEYANFNSQEAYNAELTAEGFRQGGMGDGVTLIGTGNWTPYNGEYPLTPCGYLNELGNRTGVKTMTFKVSTSTITAKVPRWRGFDNPFGDVWTNLDGIVVEKNTSLHNVWTTNDPAEYTDVIGNKRLAGHECLGEGPIKYFDLGETAEIIPISRGGSTTTYKCDYYWSGETSGLGSLFAGNDAASGLYAGLSSISTWDVSSQFTLLGFRSVSSFVSLSEIED